MSIDGNVFKEIWQRPDVENDLRALCDCGGRLAGSKGEVRARDLLIDRLTQISSKVTQQQWSFQAWRPQQSALTLTGEYDVELESTPLVMSPPTGDSALDLEVIDLGRGTPADFEAAKERIPSKAVLVRHEFPFSTGHIHRRQKYLLSCRYGAAAFIIANNVPEAGPVTGGTGDDRPDDIPSVGVSYHAGRLLARAAIADEANVRLTIDATYESWEPCNLSIEIPGSSDEWVILCAHYDGHDLAESALDNASGVAVALEAARRLAPLANQFTFGLRVMFFTVEEWGLRGSRHYLENLSQAEQAKISLVINLDTVTGHPQLSALTSERDDVEHFVKKVSASNGTPISVVRPVLPNSDHYNFARMGVPALRLIAGYEEPDTSDTRYLLTAGDTRSLVDAGQLRIAAMTVAQLAWQACTSADRVGDYRPSQAAAAVSDTGW